MKATPPRPTSTCWTEHPSEPWHCTLQVGHRGPHWHTYTRTEWPQPEVPRRETPQPLPDGH